MRSVQALVIGGVRGWPRFPPNLFAIPFGLSGLVEAWQRATPVLGTPQAMPDAIAIVAALAWLALMFCYAAQGTRRCFADLRDKTFSPFVSLAPITGMLLSAVLAVHAFAAGQALVLLFVLVTLVVGGLLTGEWIVADLDHNSAHPGYFLPTVAGGLIGGLCAAEVHLRGLGEASFGIGMLCWLLLGSTILNRLFFHRGLPAPLVPTLAIELAPPAVAGLAYFALTGGRTDFFAHALAGYAALMAVVQVRMLPRFLRLRFVPGFWAFVFSWAATATYALEWIALRRPAGADGYAVAILTLISAFVAVIMIKTADLIRRGKLLPPREVPSMSPPEAAGQNGGGQNGGGQNGDGQNEGVASQAGAAR